MYRFYGKYRLEALSHIFDNISLLDNQNDQNSRSCADIYQLTSTLDLAARAISFLEHTIQHISLGTVHQRRDQLELKW